MIKKIFILYIFVIAMPTIAFAAPQYTGWTNVSLIQDHTAYTEGMIILTTATPINPANCTLSGYYALINTSATYKTRSAMAMAAFLGGKQVNFLVDDSGCEHNGAYQRILNITIRNPQ